MSASLTTNTDTASSNANGVHQPVSLSKWSDIWKPPPQEKNNRVGAVETWREIVETIVFVVVLVLILKSFVAECFVIPTGSMAETLYGYHKNIECPSCGTQYAINCSQEVEHPEAGYRVDHGICPNCLESTRLEGSGRRSPGETNRSIPDPGPATGDRVIVSKFFNDLLNIPYARWDVVVFKYPGNSHPLDASYGNPPFPISGPQKEHTAMNYIKRLVGLPGETVAIHGGDLYHMEGVIPPADGNNPREIDLWKYENMRANASIDDFQKGKFKILRKTPKVAIAESRLVYDHDHPPADLPNLPRWNDPNGGFFADGKSAFVAKSYQSGKPNWIRYQHLLRGNNDPSTGQARKQLITDTMGYNDIFRNRALGVGNNWVSDLIVEAKVEPSPSQGAVLFELSRGPDRFEARLDLETGVAEIFRKTGPEKTSIAKIEKAIGTGKSFQVRFGNVDQTIHLWINNNIVTGDGIAYDSPKDFGPSLENDLEPASIGFEGAAGRISSIKLSRDTYYTVRNTNPQDPDVSIDDWTIGLDQANGAYPKKWEELRNLPVKTLYVQPGHYLCMGDNSSHSSDGRSWGLVPHRLMLGQAVGVYWPYGRMGRIR
jgi:signal peptidase I